MSEAVSKAINAKEIFPRQPNKEGGWTINPQYLDEVSDRDAVDPSERPSLEQIEMILLAVEPELLTKLAEIQADQKAEHDMYKINFFVMESHLTELRGQIGELEHENRLQADVLATWRERALGAEAKNKRMEEELKRAVEALEQHDKVSIREFYEIVCEALQSIKGVDPND